MPAPLDVLYEDNHLLVVNKPAGIATMGAVSGKPSLHGLAQDYIRRKYNKPGNVYLGVVSRIDSFVSGALVLARTSKAAARLSSQFAAGSPEKIYLAAVEGTVDAAADQPGAARHSSLTTGDEAEQILEDWLRKNEREHRMEVVRANSSGAKAAQLAWQCLQQVRGKSLLKIRLLTGRKHQIRVQWSAQGHPILGDTKYGGSNIRHTGIALHAARLTIEHPTKKERLTVTAPVPDWWMSLGFDEALLHFSE